MPQQGRPWNPSTDRHYTQKRTYAPARLLQTIIARLGAGNPPALLKVRSIPDSPGTGLGYPGFPSTRYKEGYVG